MRWGSISGTAGWRCAAGADKRDRLQYLLRAVQDVGVSTIICTHISKDGAMPGQTGSSTGSLPGDLHEHYRLGGVSTLEDVVALSRLGIYGAIIGRALYTGDINLKAALEAAK